MNSTPTPISYTQPTAPITYTPPPIEYPPSYQEYQPQPQSYQEYQPQPQSYQPQPQPQPIQDTGDINNLYINIQDYLDILNLLYDKTKDTFISVNTVLENMKPYIYKKVDKNI